MRKQQNVGEMVVLALSNFRAEQTSFARILKVVLTSNRSTGTDVKLIPEAFQMTKDPHILSEDQIS